uniref:Lipocalin n=1 Tax=Rhipicephalus appendiculatus TaxID=34631 RepID=A0A131YXZ4_RHIAP
MRHGVIVAIFFVIVAHTKLTEWLFPGIHVFSHRMRDFVNTREFIWVYKTSTTSPVHCKFDSMRFIQPLFIVFNRTVLYNGVRTSVALRGHFSTRNTNRMYTMHAGHTIGIESLFFKASDSSCAVIAVQPLADRATVYADLRVRNSAIRTGPTQMCTREFSRLSRRGGSILYSPNCSRELRNALL